jgi:hypothetical protein
VNRSNPASVGVDDGGAIGSLIAAHGTGSGSTLSGKFRALKEATGARSMTTTKAITT